MLLKTKGGDRVLGKITKEAAKRIQISEDKQGITDGFKARAQSQAAKKSK